MTSGAGSSSSNPQQGRSLDPLDRLRSHRVRPERARDLSSDMRAQLSTLRKVSRTESALIEAWKTASPDELASCCTPKGLRGGYLEIEVPDSSVRFRVDRWLRAGGQRELSALARVPLRGVKLMYGSKP